MTLALVNPVLWYLIDGTNTGFWLSTVVGLGGMGVYLGLVPEAIATHSEAPTIAFPNGIGGYLLVIKGFTQENIAVQTWVASVLFCACVCFGNIGRQLAVVGPTNKDNSKVRSGLS